MLDKGECMKVFILILLLSLISCAKNKDRNEVEGVAKSDPHKMTYKRLNDWKEINRLENDEAICYSTYHGLQCKWKDSK